MKRAKASVPEPAESHRLRSVSIIGGFLDGATFDLADGLNCFIGARGTGKTTALEFVRYALDAFPEGEVGVDVRKQVDSLIRHNLGGGRIRVAIQTKDGLEYVVSRTAGEEAMVLSTDGKPTSVSLKSGELFAADIYSQNQIEGIADNPMSQLALLDDFEPTAIQEVQAEIQQTQARLAASARACVDAQKNLAGLQDEVGTLPSIKDKLKALTVTKGEGAAAINKAHSEKALRERESEAVQATSEWLEEYAKYVEEMVGQFSQRARTLFGKDVLDGSNGAVLRGILKGLLVLGADLDKLFKEAGRLIGAEQGQLTAAGKKLGTAHAQQDVAFRELIEKHKTAQGQSAERTKWGKKHNELLVKQRQFKERSEALAKLRDQRAALFQTLSDLRDRRFAIRQGVADGINAEVSPQVRVRVEQYGSPGPYQELLETALKSAGIKHGVVAQRIASRISPADLVLAINDGDAEMLVSRAEINAEQAGRVISTLSGASLLYDLETVELVDLPNIELLDGGTYKDSLTLSTGQKCTAILPILLMDSENPLLIDQPEDNLDNRFVFTMVVKRIREMKPRRQLVFVTHNPNIPVLGDAEKVFVLNSTGTSAAKAREGTVDECKEEIVTLLEGGEEAFRERKRRYNY